MATFAARESGCGIFAPTSGCNQENKCTIALVRANVPLPLQVRDKKLTTSNTFVHRAESVYEPVPCFSEEVEHDILSSSFDRFQDAVAVTMTPGWPCNKPDSTIKRTTLYSAAMTPGKHGPHKYPRSFARLQ